MISVIICSVDEKYRKDFLLSVHETIGVEHEVLCVNNAIERLSIAKAYNKAACKAKYDTLVFVHEDVVFHTDNWGEKLLHWFTTLKRTGIIGVVGSAYQPISPTGWWLPSDIHLRINYLQSKKENREQVHTCLNAQEVSKVFALDGFFLALKKNTFEKLRFDEKLEGFHGYDLSISLRASDDFTNYFIPDILIEHLSTGSPNSVWIENIIKIYEEFSEKFPLPPNSKLNRKTEIQCFGLFLENLEILERDNRYKIRISYKYFKKCFSRIKSFRLCYLYLRFLAKKLFSIK